MELADRLMRQHRGRIETRLALEGRLELPQCSILSHAADEPARDLIARLVVEIARRLRREHEAEARGARALQEALQRLCGRRLRVRRDVEVRLVEHDNGLQLVVRIALAEAQRLGKELRDPEEDVLVVAEEARVDDRKACAAIRARVRSDAEQRLHAQRLAARLEERGIAVTEAVELRDEIATDLARGIHALRQLGQLGILVLQQVNEVREADFRAEARAENAQRHRERAGLLLVRRRVLQMQHVAERRRREIGEELLLMLGKLVDAGRQQRDRDRTARRAARRVDGNVDGIAEPLAQAARLAEIVITPAPDFGIGVGAEIALAVEQDDGRAVHQKLLDETKRERRLTGARTAEHGRVALQNILVERDALAASADLATGKNARRIRTVLVEDDADRQILLVLTRCRRRTTGIGRGPTRPIGETTLQARQAEAIARRRLGRQRRRPLGPGKRDEIALFGGFERGFHAAALRRNVAHGHWAGEQVEAQELPEHGEAGQQFRLLEPAAKSGVGAMARVEFAHRHHALPLGHGHDERAPAALAEFAEGLCRLVLASRRIVACAQHDGACRGEARQHLVELALQAAALGRPIADEDARLLHDAGRVRDRDIRCRQVITEVGTAHGERDGTAPFGARQLQRGREHAEQLLIVGGHLGFGKARETLPARAEINLVCRCRRTLGTTAEAEAEGGRERRDETGAIRLLGLVGRRFLVGGTALEARLRILEKAPRREAAKLGHEIGAEEFRQIDGRRIDTARDRVLLDTARKNEPRFVGRAALEQRDRARLLDAVDVGLREHAAHLVVEVAEAGDDDQRARHAVGDLDEIAHGFLEAIIGIREEAQVLDLIDAEDERRAIDRPHELAEALDDLESAALARARIERSHGRLRQLVELAALQILAHALVDARIGALEIEERAHDIDVELLLGERRARDDLVGIGDDQLGELVLVELGFSQLIELLVVERGGGELVGEPREAALALVIGIVGFLERSHEAAQVVVGIARDVRRHLRIAEIGRAGTMAGRPERADEMRLAGTGLAVEEQQTRGRRGPFGFDDRVERTLKLRARGFVHGRDVDRVGMPDVVFPGDRVLECRRKTLDRGRALYCTLHVLVVPRYKEMCCPWRDYSSTRTKCQTVFLKTVAEAWMSSRSRFSRRSDVPSTRSPVRCASVSIALNSISLSPQPACRSRTAVQTCEM